MKSKHTNLRLELGFLRDNLIEGIREGKTALISDSLEIYDELIMTFLNKLKAWASPYNRNNALQELNSIVADGWDEIEWIHDDLREILTCSIHSTNAEVIRIVSKFPIHLAQRAYQEKDYYIFYRFIQWIPQYYFLSCESADKHAQELILNHAWRGLSEFDRYSLDPDFKKTEVESELQAITDYGLGIVQTFNSLLKIAYEKKRLEDFRVFTRALQGLFQRTDSDLHDHQTTQLSMVRELRDAKNLVFYGLNSWILHHYDTERLSKEQFLEWHKAIPTFGNISDTWDLFLKSLEDQSERNFHWHWWESDEHRVPGRIMSEATWIQFDTFLQKLCCIRCLEQLKLIPIARREQVTLSMSRGQTYLADSDSSPLIKLLNGIQSDSDKWAKVVGDDGIQSIPAFINVLKKAISLRQQENHLLLIQASLSQERIDQVKHDLLKSWREDALARNIIKDHGVYEYIDTPPGNNIRYLGFNQLDRKDVYVDDPSVAVAGWGEQYGHGLADGEDKTLFDALLKSLPMENHVGAEDALKEKVDRALSKLQNDGYSPIILVFNPLVSSRVLENPETGDFSPPIDGNTKSRFKGYYKKRPLYNLFYRQQSSIVLVDLKRLGVWKQYRPRKTFQEEEYLNHELLFFVRPYSLESARQLLSEAPEFKTDKTTGTQRSDDEAVTYIQQHVHLRIIEQFSFDILDSKAGYIIKLKEFS